MVEDDSKRTQDIRDRMMIDLCRAMETVIDLAIDVATGASTIGCHVSNAQNAAGRLHAHREILTEAIAKCR